MMTDIVERLERLATWGGKATHLDYEGAILDAKAEIERLRANIERLTANPADYRYWEGRYRDEAADNERLRAALNKIMRNDPEGYEASIARRALEANDE